MNDTNIHTKTITNKTWNRIAGSFDHSFAFAFQTKAEYLEFRAGWKAHYGMLSQSIRGLKASVKVTMRAREYAGEEQRELHVQQVEATVQMRMLAEAKLEAARQYAAAKATAK